MAEVQVSEPLVFRRAQGWKVISAPFKKFENFGESNVHTYWVFSNIFPVREPVIVLAIRYRSSRRIDLRKG